MSVIKVMVVDDSPFSRTILSDTLQEAGCEVVGEADGIDNLIDIYTSCKPDLVTMDIAMPGADGFECSKLLLLHDPGVKIILVSSMKDEDTEAEARRVGVAGYVQKPVDTEILARVVQNVFEPDVLFETLRATSLDVFKEALAQSVTRMTKTTTSFINAAGMDGQFTSQGITVVIGIIGRYSGSLTMMIRLGANKGQCLGCVCNRDCIVAAGKINDFSCFYRCFRRKSAPQIRKRFGRYMQRLL